MPDSQHDDPPRDARQLPSGLIPAPGTGDLSSVLSHAPTHLKIGDVVFLIGISMYSVGLIGFVIALVNFKNTPVDQPVTGGLYKVSRHPQQLTASVSFLGTGIAIGSWIAFTVMILGVIGAHYKILAEEEACLEKYGQSYESYRKHIPRYFLFF